MSWPFRDYDFYGHRYVDIGDEIWYDRETSDLPTECAICIEAENESYTKYAHPKAHLEAHSEASITAEKMAIDKKNTEDYLDYYTFHYGREYQKIYKKMYKFYKQEYSCIILTKNYHNKKICSYHLDSIKYMK